MIKHTIQAGVVSPFPMYLDRDAVDFDEVQSEAIASVYASGGAVLWDGGALEFETDLTKVVDIMSKFNEAWQTSETMASIVKSEKEAKSKATLHLSLLLDAARKPGRLHLKNKAIAK